LLGVAWKYLPQGNTVEVRADGGHHPLETVGISDVLQNFDMELPLLFLRPVRPVRGVDHVSDYLVIGEGFRETEGRFLVVTGGEDTDLALLIHGGRLHSLGCGRPFLDGDAGVDELGDRNAGEVLHVVGTAGRCFWHLGCVVLFGGGKVG
jgi:hypothetical protein